VRSVELAGCGPFCSAVKHLLQCAFTTTWFSESYRCDFSCCF